MSDFILGLDIGTSSVKAAVFDPAGAPVAAGAARYPTYAPQPGWYEQEPSDWLQAAYKAIRQAVKQLNPQDVKVIGLCGQSPSHVLVDPAGVPLGRAIIWRDQRAARQAEWLNANLSPAEMERWTGLNNIAEVTLPPARILWLKDHQPEEWKRARYIAHPKDLLGFALTGEMATDVQTAFTLFNPAAKKYEPDYFDRLGVPLERMPPVKQPVGRIGQVTERAAGLTGLQPGTPVIAGTIDAFCDSLAGGATCPGWAVDVSGTSEVVSLGTRNLKSGQGIYLAGIGDSGHFLCGPTQAGGDTLLWLGRAFYPDTPMEGLFEKLEAEAGAAPPASAGVVFLPYLNGERAPIWDPRACGCFYGLSMEHNRKHFTRAVYEGVGYSVRHILETCQEVAGEPVTQVNICGGGSRSSFWNQVKADILQRPVFPTAVSETACLGAAMLAGTGLGWFANLEEAVKIMVRLGKPFEPRPETAERYQQGYQAYLQLYPALRPLQAGG